MDNFSNLRFALLFALAFIGLLLYQAWQRDYGASSLTDREHPAVERTATAVTAVGPATTTLPVPVADAQTNNANSAAAAAPATPAMTDDAMPVVPFITVTTDVLKAEISTRGGTIENLYLLDYPLTAERPEEKFQLFKAQEPNFYIAQSGLIGSKKAQAPSHEAMFHVAPEDVVGVSPTSPKMAYDLESGQDVMNVDLLWNNSANIAVTKRFIFRRGSYLVTLENHVANKSTAPWPVRTYTQLQRSKPLESQENSYAKSYTGTAYYTAQDKYKKLSFEDIAKSPHQIVAADGWIAMPEHYFVSAWITNQAGIKTIYTSTMPKARYVIGVYSPSVTVAPGATIVLTEQLFAGPKLQNHLAAIAPGLELTVDYGWLTVFAQPIFWLLDKLQTIFQNWGWSIIFLTILIKLAFYKLSEASYRSMADMRKLTPKLQELKDRYGSDSERLNQAMMELYKKEKINPLGGCLPILVQIPVFIALYWVLLESVEMRQAPFMLWIDNLSAADPYFVLPLLMGISMFVQQQLNPEPADPMQAKAMMLMPFIFTIFFAFFPAGLVLYWVVNNLLSIAQQWYIVRQVEGADIKNKNSESAG